MLLKPMLFALFGDYEKSIDSNKDGFGKGTLERCQDSVAEDYDEELADLIDKFVENNVDPIVAPDAMFHAIEGDYGNINVLSGVSEVRRTTQRHILKYYAIRGTKRCYTLLFNLFGFDVEIVEHFIQYSFDSPVTFDDAARVFDLGKCAGCSGYTLNLIRLSGNDPLSAKELEAITRIIKFNEPINARLVSLLFDGGPIADYNYDYSLDFFS